MALSSQHHPNGVGFARRAFRKSQNAVRSMETDERMDLLGLPPEPSWLEGVLREVHKRVADRFKAAIPQDPIL
jgi:hypothetical protein